MNRSEALTAKTWCVVGATPKQDKFGYKVYKCLKKHGYKVFPVHPVAKEIDGDICYANLSALPEKVEIVNLIVPESAGLNVLNDCVTVGVKKIWLQPGADTPAILKKAAELGLDVLQDCVLIALNEEEK